jgi:hypothetical protein
MKNMNMNLSANSGRNRRKATAVPALPISEATMKPAAKIGRPAKGKPRRRVADM